MHESGILQELIEELERLARENGARRVIGFELVTADPELADEDHLRDHFEVMARGTVAEGAQIRVRLQPGSPGRGFILQSVELER